LELLLAAPAWRSGMALRRGAPAWRSGVALGGSDTMAMAMAGGT